MKTRNQNPVVGDTICLKLFTQNSNWFSDVYNIDHVDIVQDVCGERTEENPTGEMAIETIPYDSILKDCTGNYRIDVVASHPEYTIGKYHDIWFVTFREGDIQTQIRQDFEIYPDLWITSPTPVIYSFDFRFTPNRIRQGSIKWLIIQIVPNVPRATDLERYYHNLAISAELRINIELNCGSCPPLEQDLRLIVDNELVTDRDKVHSHYRLDTTELDCGIYNIWFTLAFGGNLEVSPKMQIQIY